MHCIKYRKWRMLIENIENSEKLSVHARAFPKQFQVDLYGKYMRSYYTSMMYYTFMIHSFSSTGLAKSAELLFVESI